MSDSETLSSSLPKKKEEDTVKSDFPSIGIDLIKKINIKVSIFLFFIGLFIFSDIFIENFLPKNTVDGYCADSKGTTIQMLWFVFAYLLVDLLVQGDIL